MKPVKFEINKSFDKIYRTSAQKTPKFLGKLRQQQKLGWTYRSLSIGYEIIRLLSRIQNI